MAHTFVSIYRDILGTRKQSTVVHGRETEASDADGTDSTMLQQEKVLLKA